MKVLAIRSDFLHHGEHSGYKQILKYTEPYKVIGVDERAEVPQSKWLNAYCWPYEFIGFKFRKEIDLVHHLYADEFFRFSPRLFKVPIIGTFHQTPELLERDVIHGDLRGRIAKVTHRINRNRFDQLAAAIITNPNQKEVLKKVMPEERIHYIPLGLHLDRLRPHFNTASSLSSSKVLTVGNWQRDWDFYFKVVQSSPDIAFYLVNRKLDEAHKTLANSLPNLHYFPDANDDQLYALYSKAAVQFLPIRGMAASNAIMDGLALGCPLVITDIGAGAFEHEKQLVKSYAVGNVDQAIIELRHFIGQSDSERKSTRNACHRYALSFDWRTIAERTKALYQKILAESIEL